MHKHLFILLFSTLVFCTANIHTSQAPTVRLSASLEEYSNQGMETDDLICSINTIITSFSLTTGLFTTTIIAIAEEGFGTGSAISTVTTLFVSGAPWMVDSIRRKYKRVYQNH